MACELLTTRNICEAMRSCMAPTAKAWELGTGRWSLPRSSYGLRHGLLLRPMTASAEAGRSRVRLSPCPTLGSAEGLVASDSSGCGRGGCDARGRARGRGALWAALGWRRCPLEAAEGRPRGERWLSVRGSHSACPCAAVPAPWALRSGALAASSSGVSSDSASAAPRYAAAGAIGGGLYHAAGRELPGAGPASVPGAEDSGDGAGVWGSAGNAAALERTVPTGTPSAAAMRLSSLSSTSPASCHAAGTGNGPATGGVGGEEPAAASAVLPGPNVPTSACGAFARESWAAVTEADAALRSMARRGEACSFRSRRSRAASAISPRRRRAKFARNSERDCPCALAAGFEAKSMRLAVPFLEPDTVSSARAACEAPPACRRISAAPTRAATRSGPPGVRRLTEPVPRGRLPRRERR